SNITLPEVTGMSWVTSRPSVDLPHPDSPTSPTVSPRCTSKLTPSTALTLAPTPAGKCFTASRTRNSGASAGAGRGPTAVTVALRTGQPIHPGGVLLGELLQRRGVDGELFQQVGIFGELLEHGRLFERAQVGDHLQQIGRRAHATGRTGARIRDGCRA